MKLTSDQVHNLLHGNSEWESWVEPLQKMLPMYEIDTPERIAMFRLSVDMKVITLGYLTKT